MPSTRRQFARGSLALLVGSAGCIGSQAGDSLRELHLTLSNSTSRPLTFHFALESADGLGRWHAFELDSGDHREVVVEPEADAEWTGYHAVAGDEQVSGSLLGQGDERTCLQLDYRIEASGIRATMSTDQPRCDS